MILCLSGRVSSTKSLLISKFEARDVRQSTLEMKDPKGEIYKIATREEHLVGLDRDIKILIDTESVPDRDAYLYAKKRFKNLERVYWN